jgi:hypothetical protein
MMVKKIFGVGLAILFLLLVALAGVLVRKHLPAESHCHDLMCEGARAMAFNTVAMICVAGLAPQDCAPMPGFSVDVAIVGEASNEIECGVEMFP